MHDHISHLKKSCLDLTESETPKEKSDDLLEVQTGNSIFFKFPASDLKKGSSTCSHFAMKASSTSYRQFLHNDCSSKVWPWCEFLVFTVQAYVASFPSLP